MTSEWQEETQVKGDIRQQRVRTILTWSDTTQAVVVGRLVKKAESTFNYWVYEPYSAADKIDAITGTLVRHIYPRHNGPVEIVVGATITVQGNQYRVTEDQYARDWYLVERVERPLYSATESPSLWQRIWGWLMLFRGGRR